MESSGDEEECRSSESGWTMYLGSPMEEDSGSTDGDDENYEREEEQEQQEEEEEESDCDNVGSIHGVDGEEDGDVGNEDEDVDGYGNGNTHNCPDSDDSMASDASSRPRHPGFLSKGNEKSKQGKIRKNSKIGKK